MQFSFIFRSWCSNPAERAAELETEKVCFWEKHSRFKTVCFLSLTQSTEWAESQWPLTLWRGSAFRVTREVCGGAQSSLTSPLHLHLHNTAAVCAHIEPLLKICDYKVILLQLPVTMPSTTLPLTLLRSSHWFNPQQWVSGGSVSCSETYKS